MPKQSGFLNLEGGSYGDVTFVRTKDGFRVRRKNGISGNRIATDDNFVRTRENNAEFGRAGKSAKLLRRALSSELKKTKDGRMVPRLIKAMMAVIKSDSVSERGHRTAMLGDLSQLLNFEFNNNASLADSFDVKAATSVDRATGALTISVPSFIPKIKVAIPRGATHFKLIAAAVAINFDTESFEYSGSESGVLPWDMTPSALITFTQSLPTGSTDPLILALGIEYWQEANGNQYVLSDKSFNALGIIAVDQL